MKIIDKVLNTPWYVIIGIIIIFIIAIFHEEYSRNKGFTSDIVIELDPGYKVISMNEKASNVINYVVIHAKNSENKNVIITYKIDNSSKEVTLVHKIYVKEN